MSEFFDPSQNVADILGSNTTENILEISDSLNRLISTLDKVIVKLGELDQTMSQKTFSNLVTGLDTATSSLKNLENTSPKITVNADDTINTISSIKQTLSGLIGALPKYGPLIAQAMNILGNLLIADIQPVADDERQRQQAFLDGIANAERYAQSLDILQNSLEVLNNPYTSDEDILNTQKKLIALFPELIAGYDQQGNAILANKNEIEDYIQKQKEVMQNNRDMILNNVSTRSTPLDLAQAKKDLEDARHYMEAGEREYARINNGEKFIPGSYQQVTLANRGATDLDSLNEEVRQLEEKVASLEEETAIVERARIEENVQIIDSYGNVVNGIENLDEAQKKIAQSMTENLMKSILDGSITTEEAINRINNALSDTEAVDSFRSKLESIAAAETDYSSQIADIADLNNAYQTLANGRQLDISQLQTLSSTYPTIAAYLAETGDLTLKNGEILKEVGEIERQATIATLENDIKEIESKRNKAQEFLDAFNAQITIAEGVASLSTMEADGMLGAYGFAGSAKYQKQLFESQETIANYNIAIANAKAALEKAKQQTFSIGSGSTGISNSRSGTSSHAGATSTRNEALQNELKQIEQKKKMDQLTSQQELEWLERLRNKYSMNADEKMDLEYRIYSAQKKYQEEMEKAATDRLNAEYKAIENKRKLGELTSKEELEWLQRIQKQFTMNADQQMELEIKIYDLKKQLREDDIDALNSLGDAVTEALQKKYEEQQKLEEERIQSSIDSWQEWEEKTVDAIQGQIDALDELEREEESANQRAEYERNRQAAELQLAYEKDAYNRLQIQKEINRMEQEEQKRLQQEQRDEERRRLQEEMEKVKETSSQQQEALQKELDALTETYSKLTDSFHLQMQAEKAIMQNSQQEIINLIQSYAPQYDIAGQTLGQKLVDGFQSKVKDIVGYFEQIQASIQKYQNSLASTATQAADEFWASRAAYEKQIAAAAANGSSGKQVTMVVNFNQPVESPVEVRRELERAAENFAKRIGG